MRRRRRAWKEIADGKKSPPATLLEMAIFASYRIGLLKCSAMEPSLLCPDCKRLEREYQLTIAANLFCCRWKVQKRTRKIAPIISMAGCARRGCGGVLRTQKDSRKASFRVCAG